MTQIPRRDFLKALGIGTGALSIGIEGCSRKPTRRPNILFCIADDWGWPHAGVYGDAVVQTPTFDRLAKEGVLFKHAYVTSPSCTPCRNSILTGQYFWRLGEGANLWSTLDVRVPVFPLLLEAAGYFVGYWRKSWGPGDLKAGGYNDTHPAGKRYQDGFAQFLQSRPKDQPFLFWLGASDPHRPYEGGSGAASGINLTKIKIPDFYPDVPEIRSDIADYYYEVQRFDRDCAEAISLLEISGELENTIIVMTGDHGMPFPRCKSNIYEMGVHVPLAIRWGSRVKPARVVDDFVSFVDLAPTFLEVAGLQSFDNISGRSLCAILNSHRSGRIQKNRDHALFGKERHVPAQRAPKMDGYPCRGIRTDRFLYIRNFAPDRWPAGVPEGATHPIGKFADCDDGPTKLYLMKHKDDPEITPFYELCFAKRPAEELYDMKSDPYQLRNLAGLHEFENTRSSLSERLLLELKRNGDPRATGDPVLFDSYPYRSRSKLRKK